MAQYLDSIAFWGAGNVSGHTVKSLKVELTDRYDGGIQGRYANSETGQVYAGWSGEVKGDVFYLKVYLDTDHLAGGGDMSIYLNEIVNRSLYMFTGAYQGRLDDPTLVEIRKSFADSPKNYFRVVPRSFFSKILSGLVPNVYAACSGAGYVCGYPTV